MENPEYLTHETCPYPVDLRAYLESLFGQLKGGEDDLPYPQPEQAEARKSSYTPSELEEEIKDLLDKIESFGAAVQESGDVPAQASYFRVAAGLLEKLLNAKKEAANLKEFGRLIAFLTQFAEDEMSIDLRSKFMDGLKAFSEQ